MTTDNLKLQNLMILKMIEYIILIAHDAFRIATDNLTTPYSYEYF